MPSRIAVVLAAGKGVRMKSDLPKVLVAARGRPLIDYVLTALDEAGVERVIVVVGYRADDVRAALARRANVRFVEQREQLGTGHAVQVCREELAGHAGPVLVVTGDSPMIQAASVRELFTEFDRTRPACLLGTLHKPNPQGLGRIVRNERQEFVGIVEERDATPEEKRITEVNMSTYVFDGPELLWALGRLTNANQQKEYYLTDCPGLLRAAGKKVAALPILRPCEALSVNNPDDLAAVEAELARLTPSDTPSGSPKMSKDAELIERYAAGATKLRAAIEGLSPAELRAKPGPGDWSIQELVIHVVDSDFLAIERMKRIVAEENPTLVVADENAWVAKLHTDEQSAADACTLFEVGRRQWARVLRQLPAAAFDRRGTHTVRGPQSLRDVLTTFTNHLDHHLKFALDKRERLGKPVKK